MTRLLPAGVAIAALFAALPLVLGNRTAHALTITVDSLADTVAADGQCTLREAIENANDTVDGAAHDDCSAGDPEGVDTIDFSVDGTITLDGSPLPTVEQDLVIDPGDSDITIDGDGASRILMLDGASLTLANLAFSGGDAGAENGGAILVQSGSLTVNGCNFSGNAAEMGGAIAVVDGDLVVSDSTLQTSEATSGGGAVWIGSGSLDVTGSEFTSNAAGTSGGAISSAGAPLGVEDTAFTNNSAIESGGAIASEAAVDIADGATFDQNSATSGGAIASEGAVQVTGAAFTGNSATENGGAIFALDQLHITESTFSDNDANNGGAIDKETGGLTIASSEFDGNSAIISGGAIRASLLAEAQASITQSTFSDNHALTGGALTAMQGEFAIATSTFSLNSVTGQGGAIYNTAGLEITNSTISTNAADTRGGGLYNAGSATILNVTFAANSALGDDAGGIVNSDSGTLDITNTLVTLGNSGVNCDLAGALDGVDGSNLSDDDSCDASLFEAVDDAMLGPLDDNGGPTMTHLPEPQSPAIDGGDDASCPDTDQRGEDRIAIDHCDVGSVEVQDVPFVPTGDLFVPGLAAKVEHP